MPRLVHSEKLGRILRLDPPEEVGVPTQDFIDTALSTANRERALELLRYMRQESEILNATVLGGWLKSLTTYVRHRLGEDDLELLLRAPGHDFLRGYERLAEVRYDEAVTHIEAGRTQPAKEAVEGMRQVYKLLNDLVVRWIQDLLTFLAGRYGEGEPARAMRPAYEQIWRERYQHWNQLTPEEQLALSAEGMRAHFGGPTRRGEFTVVDEGDRYTMFFDPCGTGGVLRRGDPETGDGPYLTAGVNTEPRPETWGKRGVHWYCAHCSLYLEVFPAEDYGRPLRPLSHNLDPYAPCVWHIYKDPGLIRLEHFERIGQKAPPTRGGQP